MFRILTLLFLLYIEISADISMMLVWGKLEDTSNCTVSSLYSSSTSFQTCSSECYNTSDCIVAFMDQSNSSCFLCSFQSINSVLETTYQDNFKTAMKVNISSSTCPRNVSNEGQTIPGYNQSDGFTSTSYTVIFSNGSWQFQYTEIRTKMCPSDWKTFDRQMGAYCIKVIYNQYYNSSYNYNLWNDAQKLCVTYNAVLSGIENLAELDYINGILNDFMTPGSYTWLGALRKSDCTPPNWNTTICNNTASTFAWIDLFTVGTAGFQWMTNQGEPQTYDADGNQLNCAGISTFSTNSSGLLKTLCCSQSSYAKYITGLVCGKQPDS